MIKTLRKINFGYFLIGAGCIMLLVAYQRMTGETPPPDGKAGSGLEWLKGPAVFLAGMYVIFAGGLKIHKSRPRKTAPKKPKQ